jgi:AhpD family alkylhydroperoxidase
MNHPVVTLPDAMTALQSLSKASEGSGLSATTIALVQLRASQINGCSVCVDMHAKLMKRRGESDERLLSVAAWRDTPYFDEAERAALELAEAVTRIADRPEPVPDTLWEKAAAHYDEKQLSALLLSVAAINVWNRLNVATRQPAGVWQP